MDQHIKDAYLNRFIKDIQTATLGFDHLLKADYHLTPENTSFIKGIMTMHNRLPSDKK